MSVVILYRGQRKAFKCGSAPMKSVVDDAVLHFKIKSTAQFDLLHKNKRVDLSTPFLMSSIPNNALLELVCSDKRDPTGACAETRVAISCDSGFGNLSGKFRSDMTLLEVLASFVEQGSLPAPLLDASLAFSPPLEVIYLRQRFVGLEALHACSLASLGLAGSSARLQLRVPTAVLDSAPVSASISTEQSAETTPPSPASGTTSTPMDIEEPETLGAGSREVPALSTVCMEKKGKGEEDEALRGIDSHAPILPQVQVKVQVAQSDKEQQHGSDSQSMGVALFDKADEQSSLLDAGITIPAAVAPPGITPAGVHAAVTAILDANFDAASKKAIATSLKFLDNLIKFPNSEQDIKQDAVAADAAGLAKYRSINLANPIVREQILSCKEGVELLLALGFVAEQEKGVPPAALPFSGGAQRSPQRLVFGYALVRQDWQLSPHTLAGYSLQSEGLQPCRDEVVVSTLLAAREVLCAALAELDRSSSSSSSSAKSSPVSTLALLQSIAQRQAPAEQGLAAAAPVVQFDPYKPFIMRAGADKVVVKASTSAGGSSTVSKLNQLNKRRRELEGDRTSVQRMTRVSMKAAFTKEAQKEVQDDEDGAEETDGQIQARALKQALLRLGTQEDEGPALTTRAVKELELAQKALVYSQTLIRVSLPDKVCLQAYFHPRDTVHDIAHWLRTECFAESGAEEDARMEVDSDAGGAAPPLHDFDLYTSPPRRSLFAPPPPPAGGRLADRDADPQEVASLLDLSLVPAAVVHLAWQGASARRHTAASAGGGAAGGSYLSPSLLAELQGDMGDALGAASSIPSGQRLVPESSKDSSQQPSQQVSHSSRGRSQEGSAGSGSGSSGSSGGAKPKWFKL